MGLRSNFLFRVLSTKISKLHKGQKITFQNDLIRPGLGDTLGHLRSEIESFGSIHSILYIEEVTYLNGVQT